MTATVAVLGPGGVGGTIAAHLDAAGVRVICVARPETARIVREHGLEVRAPDGSVVRAAPRVAESLAEPVDVLVIAVKAPALADALLHVLPAAVASAVVVPLLNGLEHPAEIRTALGRRVAPGSVSRFEAYVESPGRIVQRSRSGVLTVASHDIPRPELEEALAPLGTSGFDLMIGGDEHALLWEKAVRLAVLAAATSASGLAVGELRTTPWRERLDAALGETCRVAAVVGVEVTPAAQWEIIDAMDSSLTTSTARDVAAGRPSELDAISGSVLRVAARARLACPELESLMVEARERAA